MGKQRSFWSTRFTRRQAVGTIAVGTASVGLFGRAGWAQRALAQEATPTTGCIGPAPTTTVATVPAGTKLSVALVPKLVHPFFEDCRIGAEQKANELGVDFQWVVPQTGDPAIQVQMIEDLVRTQVHAIVISPNEPTSVEPVIADAMSKGILIMTFDSDSPNSQRLIYIGTDNKTAGSVQGQTLSTLIGGTGKIGIIDATMVQRPVQMGVLSIQWAFDILTGVATPSCTNIDTGVTVVTKDNLTTYTK